MDTPNALPEHDVLSLPIRAQLFRALVQLRRPATTQELAQTVGRHPNSARTQLQRLEDAGLIECRREQQVRGRPRHTWVVCPDARPGGAAPEAHGDLSRWLARAMRRGNRLVDVEEAGREIGRELAPDPGPRAIGEVMHDVLTALGFSPRREPAGGGNLRYVLGNCPYRQAVAENPHVICTLHRGITQGLLDGLDTERRLEGFVAKDPFEAGCLIELAP